MKKFQDSNNSEKDNRGVHNSLLVFQSPLIFFLTNSISDVKFWANFTTPILHTTCNQKDGQAVTPAGTERWDKIIKNLKFVFSLFERAKFQVHRIHKAALEISKQHQKINQWKSCFEHPQ